MSSEPTSEIPPGYQFRLWHLFALLTWCGALMAFFASDRYAPMGVVLVAFTACAVAFRVRTAAGVVLTMLMLLGICILPGFQRTHINTRRGQCINNLKSISLALRNYESVYGTLPPAYIADEQGKPMHSWRVLLLPYLEQNALYKQYRFDEPWDGPNNRLLHNKIVPLLCCPSDQVASPTETSYLAVLGDHTAWPGEKGATIAAIEAADGGRQTILVIETHNSGIHWMEPRDVTLDDCLKGLAGPLPGNRARTTSNHEHGDVAVFVDGHASVIPSSTSPQELRELLTVDDGKPNERTDDEIFD